MTHLEPTVIIEDYQGNELYRFDKNVQDINLIECSIHAGIQTDVGNAKLLIDDLDNKLHDITNPNRPTTFKKRYGVRILLNDKLWFFGYVISSTTQRPGYNQQQITIFAAGAGVLLGMREGDVEYAQALNPDGTATDEDDDSTTISNMIRRTISDGLANSKLGDLDITEGHIGDTIVKLPYYSQQRVYISSILHDLSQIGGGLYFVSPDKKFNFYTYDESRPSGLLITNDLPTNWPENMVLKSKNKAFSYQDSSGELGADILNIFGSQYLTVVAKQTDRDSNASLSNDVIFSWTANLNTRRIYIGMSRTGIITEPLVVHVFDKFDTTKREQDDIKQTVVISASRLNAIPLNTNGWIEITLDNIDFDGIAYMMIESHSEGANLNIQYMADEGNFSRYIDGSWKGTAGAICLQSYTGIGQKLIIENTERDLDTPIKELIINLPTQPSTDTAGLIAEAMMERKSQTLRTYADITCVIADHVPPIGRTIKLFDKLNGLNTNPTLTGYDVKWSALNKQSSKGPSEITLFLTEFL